MVPDVRAPGTWVITIEDWGVGMRAEAWTPQMLSLERLAAFSLKKGCYPGQEIVARTHYLGKSKRSLVRIEGRDLASGQSLLGGAGEELGQLASATDDGRQALAVAATRGLLVTRRGSA